MMTNTCESKNLKNLAGFDFFDLCLLGETGTGKTHTARLIHEMSPRKEKPFIAINCAELSPSIIEAELFGYEKGAFTGAITAKTGKFEAANGGTIFLDEIGELKTDIQAKLLKVVEEKCVTRIGSNVPRSLDLRIIYATNRDLTVLRNDLRFRIAAHAITLKPLRQRPEEIVPLAERFIKDFCQRTGTVILSSRSSLALLEQFKWEGNVRQLRSFIEKVCFDALLDRKKTPERGSSSRRRKLLPEITVQILLPRLKEFDGFEINQCQINQKIDKSGQEPENTESQLKLEDFQKEVKTFEFHLVIGFLRKNMRNITHTAAEMGLSRYGLHKKLKRLGIDPKTC